MSPILDAMAPMLGRWDGGTGAGGCMELKGLCGFEGGWRGLYRAVWSWGDYIGYVTI